MQDSGHGRRGAVTAVRLNRWWPDLVDGLSALYDEQAEIARLRRQLDLAQRRLSTTEAALSITRATAALTGLSRATAGRKPATANASPAAQYHRKSPRRLGSTNPNQNYRTPDRRTVSFDLTDTAGPVGLSTMMTAELYGASRVIAIDKNRLAQAKSFGATDAVDSGGAGWRDELMAMTDGGLGVDVAIEAVGIPQTFHMATDIIRVGGTVANVGVHGESVELKLQELWIKDIAITTGLVSATSTPMLLRLVTQGKLTPDKFVSHRFTFDSIIDAYDSFGRAAETKALKVIITR